MQEASDRCGQHHNMTFNFLVGRLNPESFDPWEEEACVPQANRLEQRTAISAITLAKRTYYPEPILRKMCLGVAVVSFVWSQ